MTARPTLLAALALALLAGPGVARLDLAMPAATTTETMQSGGRDGLALPSGPHREGAAPVVEAAGPVLHRAWRLGESTLTTAQILDPLREQVEAAGYEVLFECADRACGGFDFRFALPLLPAPDMFVDLGDFRYMLARRGRGGSAEHLALTVSRAGVTGFVQLTEVGSAEPLEAVPGTAADPALAPQDGTAAPADAPPLGQALLERGHVVLDGLAFPSGTAELTEGPYPALADLAAFLAERPGARIVLVGHTDAVGALDANIALSRQRAQAVAERLVARYGVDPAQLRGEGMGYLAPVASNLTPEGRERNRRVEAVLTALD